MSTWLLLLLRKVLWNRGKNNVVCSVGREVVFRWWPVCSSLTLMSIFKPPNAKSKLLFLHRNHSCSDGKFPDTSNIWNDKGYPSHCSSQCTQKSVKGWESRGCWATTFLLGLSQDIVPEAWKQCKKKSRTRKVIPSKCCGLQGSVLHINGVDNI